MPERPLPPEELVRHAAFLRNLGRRLLLDPDRLEDARQETMLRGLEQGPRDPKKARGWLAQVFRNAARQDHRSAQRRKARERRVGTDERLEPTVDAVARHEVMRRVADAVMALPAPYRDVVLLRFYDGLAPRHIAERLETPLATVKSRLQRALNSLRATLDASDRAGARSWRVGLAAVAGLEHTELHAGAALATGGIVKAKGMSIGIGLALLLAAGAGAYVALQGDARHAGSAHTDVADSGMRTPAANAKGPATKAPQANPDGRQLPLAANGDEATQEEGDTDGPDGKAAESPSGRGPGGAPVVGDSKPTLDTTRVSLDVADQSLPSVVKILSLQTGMNILISPLIAERAQAVEIGRLRLTDVPLRAALTAISQPYDLDWTERDTGTIVLHAAE